MQILISFFFFFHIFQNPCLSQTASIIVSNWPLWSECIPSLSPTTFQSPIFSTKFQGFLIDIFTNSLPRSFSGNLTFYCYDWNDTIIMLSNFSTNPPTEQFIFLGPLPSQTVNTYNNSFLFSYPIYSSNLYMVQQPIYSLNIYFYYLQGFDILLWFFILLLVLAASHLLWIFERSDDNKMPLRYLEGIKEATWQILLYIFFMGGKPIRSLPGRGLICAMLITSYLLMVNFLCSTVSRMLNSYENINFSDLQDLKNTDVVYSFEEYADFVKLNNPSVTISTTSWGFYSNLNLINIAQRGDGHLLLPNFLADAAINNSCILQKSSAYYLSNFFLSFIFTNNIDQCNNTNIDFSQMYGIWILFTCGLVLSFGSFGVRILLQKLLWKNVDHYEKIFGKNPLRRGFKRLIYEEKKLIQQALIEYFDRILMIYESKHKEILKTLKSVVEEKRDTIEKVEEKLKDLYSQLEY